MIGLPIVDCRLPIEDQRMTQTGNWKSQIGNEKSPAPNNAGLQNRFEVFGSLFQAARAV